MDFRGWKKIKEDDKTCMLEHPKGHRLTVALRGLSSLHRDQIKMLKMAEGGSVSALEYRKPKPASEESGRASGYVQGHGVVQRGVESPAKKDPRKSFRGADVKNAHHAKDQEEKAHYNQNAKNAASRNLRDLKSMPNPNLKGLADGGVVHHIHHYEDGGSVDDSSSQDDSGNGHTTNVYVNTPQSGSQPTNPAAAMANNQIPVNVPQPQNGPVNTNPNGQVNPSAVSKNMVNTVPAAQKDIDTAQAQAEGQNLNQYNKALGDIEQQRSDQYQDMTKHVNDFSQYLQENPIDPKHYQENMGTGSKVATAIGLFFGGLGTPFGGTNYAQDFLNKQIDRDIQSQRDRADQQKTIYGAYQKLYGDGQQAIAATKATMLDIYNNKQKQIAAQLGTPIAAQKSQILSNQMAIEAQKGLRDTAVSLPALPGYNTNSTQQKSNVAPMGNAPVKSMSTPTPSSGAPSPQGSNVIPMKGAPKNDLNTWYDSHILHPNADQISKNLQYNPQAKEVYPAIMEQKSKADLADKALQTIDQVFPALENQTNGLSGYYHRNGFPVAGHLPMVGAAFNNGVENATDTPSNREYDSNYSALTGAIRGALQGNVSEDLLDKVVKSNAPETNDNGKVLDTKMKTLKEFIKSHTKTDLLRQFGLTKN